MNKNTTENLKRKLKQLTDIFSPFRFVDEGGDVRHDGHGVQQVLPVSVNFLGALKLEEKIIFLHNCHQKEINCNLASYFNIICTRSQAFRSPRCE
jgi:hypothetical protein